MRTFLLSILFLGLLTPLLADFFLPGVAPGAYEKGEKVDLQVKKITSTKTQLPFEYYDLPFCRRKHRKIQAENLGEKMQGDLVELSPYHLKMGEDVNCAALCVKAYKKSHMKLFQSLIDDEYRVHWLLDNLPVIVRNEALGFVSRGYPIGFRLVDENNRKKGHYLYNHVRIIVRYHSDPLKFNGARVVGFEVVPFSVNHQMKEGVTSFSSDGPSILKTCSADSLLKQDHGNMQSVDRADKVVFTYDVLWEQTDLEWSSRWDVYLKGNPDDEIHYFSIINSLMIVFFLSGVVAMIMLRTLRRDISTYNERSNRLQGGSKPSASSSSSDTSGLLDDIQEETGWKLVYGDVFRPPSHEMMLSVLVGSGVQVIGMATALMVFALLGFVSPANRGGLLTLLLILFSFMGYLAGFYGQKLYTLFQGKKWTLQTILTAVFFPGSLFFLFILINLSVFSEGSSSAMSFSTFFILMLLWFGISTPLVFLGSYFGKKEHNQIEVPVPVKQIHRVIPDQVWYTHPLFSILLGGILPFGAVCIELFFIMSALWLDQIYYVFGFLFIVLLILVITSAEITIVMCYFQLCSEDYRWWWRSFYTSGSAGLYLFAYAIWYFVSKLDMQHTSSIFVYFSYMAMISMAFSLFCGTVGFFSSLWFVKKIYAAIKID